MRPQPKKSEQAQVTPSELRESCCAMREATEKMAKLYGFKPPACPRKDQCLQQAARAAV